ncbi:MAG TPA: hypothetical protein VET87_18275, partial [Rubrivivax sp.]|nr:hypothetical protein [Rubrivivax sp.]
LDLLDAQRALRAAELADTDTRTLLALSAVQLVKALGGGWLSAEPVAVAGTPVASSVGRETAAILPPPLPTLRGNR